MKCVRLASTDLDWRLDFSPLRKTPEFVPILCAATDEPLGTKITALTGFDLRFRESVSAVVLDASSEASLMALWPRESLAPLENLRFQRVLGQPVLQEYLIRDWPLEFQNFLDSRRISLKNLRPLEYLTDFKNELTVSILKFQPSHSQAREILDLLCDLKMAGASWENLAPADSPQTHSIDAWIAALRKSRTPRTFAADAKSGQEISKISWPRGTHAKWERQGDQAGLVIQSRVNSPGEWKRLRETLSRLEIGDSVWT